MREGQKLKRENKELEFESRACKSQGSAGGALHSEGKRRRF